MALILSLAWLYVLRAAFTLECGHLGIEIQHKPTGSDYPPDLHWAQHHPILSRNGLKGA
jgi:hypothetical protein